MQRWLSFLHNHREALAAADFFMVPTATFQVLHVFFVIHHDRRRLLHFNVTCPLQNGVAERWIGSVRRELLDHVVVLNAKHLKRILSDYDAYYADYTTLLGLRGDTPAQRAVDRRPGTGAVACAEPWVGGLHHRYHWKRAA